MIAPGGRDFGAAKWCWFWRWAAQHTSLRTLTFDVGGDEVPAPSGWEAALAALLAARPAGLHAGQCDFASLIDG